MPLNPSEVGGVIDTSTDGNAFSAEPQGIEGVAPAQPNAPALSPTAQQSVGQAMTYGLPGLGVGLLDTLGQSIGVFHNDTVPNVLKKMMGSGEGSFGDFYSRDQQSLRTGGEVVGMFLPGAAGMYALKSIRLAREAGTLGEIVNSGKLGASLDVILGSSANLTAMEGKIATEAYSGAAQAQGVWAGRTVLSPSLVKAKNAYYAAKAVDAIRTTAAFELGNRIAFNSSNTFYPADYTLTDQIKWAVAGGVVGVGLEMAAAKYAVRNAIQGAVKAANVDGAVEKNVGPLAKYAPDLTFVPGSRGVGISVLAGMKSDLKASATTNINPQFQTNVASDLTTGSSIIKAQLNNMAQDAHPFFPRMSLSEDQFKLASDALDKDSTAFLYGKKLATLPEDGAASFYKGVAKQVENAQRKIDIAVQPGNVAKLSPDKQENLMTGLHTQLNNLVEASNQQHYVIENDGRWSVYRNRADNWLDQNNFDDIKRSTYSTPELDANGQKVQLKNSKLMVPGSDMTLHDNFLIENMGKSPTPMDFSQLYAMGSKFIENYKPVEGQVFRVTPDLNWRSLEGITALADAKPDAASAIQFGGSFQQLDDVRFNVMNQKFQQFNQLMGQTSKEPLTGLAARMASNKANYSPAQVIQMLNLPEIQGNVPNPVIEMFAHAKLQGMTDLNDMFPAMKPAFGTTADTTQWDMLNQHLRETAGVTDQKVQIPTSGPLLKQGPAKPIMVAADSVPLNNRVDAMIGARVQALRDVQLEKLGNINPKDSPLVSSVINTIALNKGDMPASADVARSVQTLQDDMVSSGQIVYQDRVNEAFPALKAMQLIAQNGDTFTRNYVEKLAQGVKLPDQVSSMLNPRNRADLLDFNRIEHSYRHGYEIEKLVPNPLGDGYVFQLAKDSNINASLKEKWFSGLADDGSEAFMPDMSVTGLKPNQYGYVTRKPLIVSKPAGDLAQTISNLSRQSGKENNALRIALGKSPVQLRDFHLPTPEISNQNAWFIRNSRGRVVATYGDSTYNGNRQRAQTAASELLGQTGDNHVAVPVDSVARDHQLLDDHFHELIDYSDQLAKDSTAITGGLARREIDTTPRTLTDMAGSLQSQFLNIGIRARAAVFEPELNYAYQASVAGQAGRDNIGKTNVFDRYIATTFSRNPSAGQGIGKIYTAAESWMDQQLSWLNTKIAPIGSGDNAGAKLVRTVLMKQTPEEEYKQFSKTLPEWSPFTDATKWAESTFKEGAPWKVRAASSGITRLASTMSLRIMDLGMVMNNFAGLATNMPSVVTALRRLPGESDEIWHSRTAAYSSEMVGGVKTFSPQKALMTAGAAFFDPKMTAALEDAAAHGYAQPEFASLSRALNVHSNSWSGKAFDKFMNGATWMVDHSEIASRKWSWIMGYKIAKDLHGMQDDRNAYLFANNFVNDMIGNYAPNNKPAMFTGALGVPLGAFQTYMGNFYRRLYGMVERGDKAGLLAQYTAQASVFGVKSTPGYALWNSMFQSNDVGSDDFTGRVNRQLAPGIGELVLNGTLSNIPKIFGAQNSGISWYTRGSVDATATAGNLAHSPFPTLVDLNRTPPAQFLARVAEGINRTAKNVFSNEHFSVQQQEEILATMSTNRAFKSIMELAANAKTDARGNVIEYGTRDAIHVAAALLGAQPSYVQSMQEATNKQRQVQLQQESLRSDLNDKTRALFRGGEFEISDMQGIVKDYIHSGGNTAYLGEWMRNSMAASVTPQADVKLKELARSGKLLQFQDMLATLQQNSGPNPQKGK